MSNPTVDSYVQQYFGNNAPPGLSDVAYLKAEDATPGGGPRQLMARMQLAQQYIQNLASSGDIKSYIQDATNTLANKYTYYNLQGTDSSGLLKDIQSLVNSASNYGLNSADLAKQFNDAINTEQQKYVESKQNLDTGGLGGFLNNFISAATNPVTMAAIVAAPATGGASAALASSLASAGVDAAIASTIATSVVASATSATLAAVTGGDVTKSAISGAITGGAAANASDIANAVTNNSVNAIASSTGLTAAQVSNTITNAITSGVVTAAVTGGDVATAVASSLASSGVSAEVQNTINNNLPDMSGTAKLVGNVAGVATKAAVSGTDISTAIQNSIPQIIGGQLQDTTKTDTTKTDTQTSQADTTPTAVVVSTDPSNNTALVIDTSGNVNVVATTDNIPSGSTVNIDPTTNVATVANVPTTGQTFAPTASTDATPLVKTENKVTVSGAPFLKETAPENLKIPEGYHLLSAAEAQGQVATELADGSYAFIAPDELKNTFTPDPKAQVPDLYNLTVPSTVISSDSTKKTSDIPTFVQGTPISDVQTVDINTPSTSTTLQTTTPQTPPPPPAATVIEPTTVIDPNKPILDLINQPTTTTITPTITNVPTTQTIDTTTVGQPSASSQNVTATAGGGDGTSVLSTPSKPDVTTTTTTDETKLTETAPTKEADTTKDTVTSPTISPTVIYPSTKQPQLGGILGASPSSILGQALAAQYETSPGGSPITLGDEGKRRNVWNVESLRNALGI